MRYRFELAGIADDADLRHVLSKTPMPGAISIRFEREPSYFDASVVDGRFRQIVACRDTDSGRFVGFGSCSIIDRFVNGEPRAIGYLSNLRLLPSHRNRGLVARGYRMFRELHGDGRAQLYLTTIARGNEPAMRMLTSRKAGLPHYHPAGQYLTAALNKANIAGKQPTAFEVKSANPNDAATIIAFLRQEGPRRQFFPCYQDGDLFNDKGLFRGLLPEDVMIARDKNGIIGVLGVWDQSAFRQTVIESYSGMLRWGRRLHNFWAKFRGRPALPSPGESLRHRVAALIAINGDKADVFHCLIGAALSRCNRNEYLLVGLHESDPLLPQLQQYRSTWYSTSLFLVDWDDGQVVRQALDHRPIYLELGSL